jgi:hypothetical protein
VHRKRKTRDHRVKDWFQNGCILSEHGSCMWTSWTGSGWRSVECFCDNGFEVARTITSCQRTTCGRNGIVGLAN